MYGKKECSVMGVPIIIGHRHHHMLCVDVQIIGEHVVMNTPLKVAHIGVVTRI